MRIKCVYNTNQFCWSRSSLLPFLLLKVFGAKQHLPKWVCSGRLLTLSSDVHDRAWARSSSWTDFLNSELKDATNFKISYFSFLSLIQPASLISHANFTQLHLAQSTFRFRSQLLILWRLFSLHIQSSTFFDSQGLQTKKFLSPKSNKSIPRVPYMLALLWLLPSPEREKR